MPRHPQDTLPQVRLVIELKLAIDRRDAEAVTVLIEENPRSAWAQHVQHNIGKRRSRWMGMLHALNDGVLI